MYELSWQERGTREKRTRAFESAEEAKDFADAYSGETLFWRKAGTGWIGEPDDYGDIGVFAWVVKPAGEPA